jgi:ferredoxin-NADP reductase
VKARFIGFRELAPEVRHFDFEVPGVEEFAFTPGQFISTVKTIDGKEITRAYSIASPRNGNRFSLCLNRIEHGLISPYLFSLHAGDEVDIQEPLGYFTMRHPGHRAVFVAAGTGIAPFRSILLEYLPKLEPHVTLLFGARYEHGLLYREEFERLASEHSHFHFVPTITRPEPSWTGRTGRVQQHLDEALNLEPGADLSTIDVYICGLKEMVDDVRRELKKRGFDRKQIIYEKYD